MNRRVIVIAGEHEYVGYLIAVQTHSANQPALAVVELLNGTIHTYDLDAVRFELKRCPVCGSIPTVYSRTNNIVCDTCGKRIEAGGYPKPTRELLVDLWNNALDATDAIHT